MDISLGTLPLGVVSLIVSRLDDPFLASNTLWSTITKSRTRSLCNDLAEVASRSQAVHLFSSENEQHRSYQAQKYFSRVSLNLEGSWIWPQRRPLKRYPDHNMRLTFALTEIERQQHDLTMLGRCRVVQSM